MCIGRMPIDNPAQSSSRSALTQTQLSTCMDHMCMSANPYLTMQASATFPQGIDAVCYLIVMLTNSLSDYTHKLAHLN